MTATASSMTNPARASKWGLNVSDVVADVIVDRAPITFGVMGNGNAFVVGGLVDRNHRYVKARHEAGAMSMAQGYYMATGAIAVTTTTYGPGYTNILTVLAEASIARTPIVVVVGEGPRPRRPFDIDQAAVAEAVGVSTFSVSKDDAHALTHRAFDLAERDLKPVIVSIPYDVAEATPASQKPVGAVEAHEVVKPLDEDVTEIAGVLSQAERLLIITGRGAMLSGAGQAVQQAGDKLGALFATSVMARHLVPSEWDLGIAGGFATPGAVELMRNADVVLVLGASMNNFQMRYGTLLPAAHTVIQVDTAVDPTSDLVTRYVRSDARLFAEKLGGLLRQRTSRTWRDEAPHVADGAIHAPEDLVEYGADGRINPRALAIRMNELLPKQRTIVQDGGHFLGWLAMYASVPDPYALQHPGLSFHAIGVGFPTALGAALGRPDRLTVLACGDGGGMMTLPDLETLVRVAPRALVVVFNDSAYGMEVHQYSPRGIAATPMVFDEVDFAALGEAVGARALRVTDLAQLEAVAEWVESDEAGVFVVDVKISPAFVAEYVTEKVAFENSGN